MLRQAAFSVARAAGFLSRGLGWGSGTTAPGATALRLRPRALEELSRGRRVVLVSGTNGKTTVTALLSAALSDPLAGGATVTNEGGSNLPAGLVTALLTRRGPVAALEVDEVVLGRAVACCGPEVVVLLNLSRDQLDRTAEVQTHATRWAEALRHTGCRIVANADDPLVVHAVFSARPEGVGAQRVDWVAAGRSWEADCPFCPRCHHVWQLRDSPWGCSACGFARPHPQWSLRGNVLCTPYGDDVVLPIALPGRVNAANAAMAIAAAAAMGTRPDMASERLSQVRTVSGRYAVSTLAGRSVRLLLGKNPASWAALLDELEPGDGAVIIAVNARAADGRDPSWLWDVPVGRLAGHPVIVVGERAQDVSTRLRYAEVPHEVAVDLPDAVARVRGRTADVVANYTAFTEAALLLGRSPSTDVAARSWGTDATPARRERRERRGAAA